MHEARGSPAAASGEGARPEPDVLYVAAERADRWHNKRLVGAADFVGEFLSDWSVGYDRERRFLEHQRAGVREYLIIDRRQPGRFEYYGLDAKGIYQPVAPDALGRYHSESIPGFWLDPNWFWQNPLPDVEDALFAIADPAYDEWLATKRRTWMAGQSDG